MNLASVVAENGRFFPTAIEFFGDGMEWIFSNQSIVT
jgi:hypothetical protein